MGLFSGKLLAADFDDTLRPFGQRDLPESNLRAIRRFQSEGGLFTLATGRDPRSFLSIQELVPCNAPVVLSNGAVIFDAASGRNLYESALPHTSRRDLAALLAAFPALGLEIIQNTEVFVARGSENLVRHLDSMGAQIQWMALADIPFPWTKAAAVLPGENAAWEVIAWLQEQFPGRYDAVASGVIVDIAAAGNNKGTGVGRLAEYLSISRENVICVGDGWNDLPMLRYAERAFAPENAVDEVKKEPGVTVVGPCVSCMANILAILEEE